MYDINALCWEMKGVAKNNFGIYTTKADTKKNVKLAIKQMVKDFKNILEQNSADIVNEIMQK